ncbi:hypothetical protein RQP46_005709 [Phenoliferia psychrophenolica]
MSTTAAGAPPKARASDVRRRAVLPTTLQLVANASSQPSGAAHLGADEFLDKMEEDLNRKVDHDVEILVDGMADLVKVHQITHKDHFRVAQDAFQAQVRTDTMIRAAHSLLSLAHTLKLLHLFADTATPAAAMDARAKVLDEEIRRAKEAVEGMVRDDGEGPVAV